jgi:hypothetical protein
MSTAVVASQVPQVEPSSSGKLDWHIVLESLIDGQVAASIAELPDCKVIEGSRDEAIAAVRSALDERLGAIEVVPIEIDVTTPEHPIMKFVGIFKDDPSFIAWSDEFWAEKQRSHDDDEILSLEEFLQEG